MKEDLFNELIASVKEGGEILRGKRKPSREFIFEPIDIAPATLLPADVERLGVQVFTDMVAGLKDADVVIMLRLQNERMNGELLPSAQEYFRNYGLSPEKFANARPDAIVMHPGPMNRGVEIDSRVADGSQSVILPQVTFGIAVRMAVMSILAGGQP